MKIYILKILFLFFIYSNVSFGQSRSVNIINEEMFILPKKWKLTGKLEKYGQFIFKNEKQKLAILINVRDPKNFELYDKEDSEVEFLNKFYKWEIDFFVENYPSVKYEKIETNENEKFIIWKIKVFEDDIENTIITGIRNGKLIGVSMFDYNEEKPKTLIEKIEFIKKIYFRDFKI